jgi:hypothetical protein
MTAALTTRIPIRDRNGDVVDEKEVATYAGLLAQAHDEGLKAIVTSILQVPTEDNGHLAIVLARVETDKGSFTGIGDASPDNVNHRIRPHIIRMAETRAKARALRDAVNIGVVALEELGDDAPEEVYQPPAQRQPDNVRPFRSGGPAAQPSQQEHRDFRKAGSQAPGMSEAQRRLLYRLLSQAGFEGEVATNMLLTSGGVSSLDEITKRKASELIDGWKREVERA